MKHFDINNIIKYYNIDTKELAKVLFPSVKHPNHAFDRIVKGESELSISQLEKLASYIGVIVEDLFAINNTWKGSLEDECLVFSAREYKAKLNYKGVFLTLYKNENCIGTYIGNMPNMTLKEFISYLNTLINLYENEN